MTWFWFNHFNVQAGKRDICAMVGDYEPTLHDRAFGHYRDILAATLEHPAMLRYLDNDQHAVGHILSQASEGWSALPEVYDDGGLSVARSSALPFGGCWVRWRRDASTSSSSTRSTASPAPARLLQARRGV